MPRNYWTFPFRDICNPLEYAASQQFLKFYFLKTDKTFVIFVLPQNTKYGCKSFLWLHEDYYSLACLTICFYDLLWTYVQVLIIIFLLLRSSEKRTKSSGGSKESKQPVKMWVTYYLRLRSEICPLCLLM